jgi:hypothetical protein
MTVMPLIMVIMPFFSGSHQTLEGDPRWGEFLARCECFAEIIRAALTVLACGCTHANPSPCSSSSTPGRSQAYGIIVRVEGFTGFCTLPRLPTSLRQLLRFAIHEAHAQVDAQLKDLKIFENRQADRFYVAMQALRCAIGSNCELF